MSKLQDKVAIVTGAAVGVGREIAVTFARAGAAVVVNYSKSHAEATETAEMVSNAGGRPLLFRADVSDDSAVRAMVAATLEWAPFGHSRVDVLVNNAGITAHVPFDDLEGLSNDIWDRLYGVNVKGTFFCSRAVAGPMRQAGQGRIINLASVAGMRPWGSSIAYSASKAALIQVSRCLAKTLGPEIRVNVVSPGAVAETRWNSQRVGIDLVALNKRSADGVPLKRVGLPSDVAELVLYLATGADFMTGAVLTLDGGRELV
jgi:3-oxoacyl-[acyl-carrier protein] reductase